MYNDQSNPTLATVTFSGNLSSNYSGGGMSSINSSPVLTHVTFTENEGGGMYNEHGSPTLNHVLFLANSSLQGGGMRNFDCSPELSDVTFSRNTATRGGGLSNVYSSPTLINVTFVENRAIDSTSQIGLGGGMANYNSSPELTNVTFSANSSSGHGGGVYNEENSNPLLTNVTITGNTATISGGGIANFGQSLDHLPSNPVLSNTILWGNSLDQIFNSGSSSASVSYSVIQGGYSGGTNIITDDPFLGPLADNGGFTMTHALRAGSSAIDAGDPAVCPETDQRGVSRPLGSGCDIGAVEYQPMIFLPLMIR
jgi:predicted outer membrane repeat protein